MQKPLLCSYTGITVRRNDTERQANTFRVLIEPSQGPYLGTNPQPTFQRTLQSIYYKASLLKGPLEEGMQGIRQAALGWEAAMQRRTSGKYTTS